MVRELNLGSKGYRFESKGVAVEGYHYKNREASTHQGKYMGDIHSPFFLGSVKQS